MFIAHPSPTTVEVIEARKPKIDRLNRLLDEIRAADPVDISMLAVANRQLRSLVAS